MKSRLKDTLLLVGSTNSDRPKLFDIFSEHFYLLEADTAEQGVLLLAQNSRCIAAVLADLPISNTGGFRALVEASHPGSENEIPVIALIAHAKTGEHEELAFLLGVADVVHKPYTALSIQRRLQVLIDLYTHRWHLQQLVHEQSQTLRNANQTVLDALSAMIEYRSAESGNHVLRIRRLTQILLQEVARCCPEYKLTEEMVDTISSASSLHDIGKISIPDSILNKPGKLTPAEFDIMKTHTTTGAALVEQLEGMGDIMYLRYTYNICLYHHERWDGGGYPQRLKGNEIPICAQVVGIADAFDALTTHRVYKPAYEYDTAVNMILNGECGLFSPQLLECFKHVQQEMIDLAKKYADGYSPKSDQIRVPLPNPEHRPQALNSLQLSQLKYQTLLHHLNDTIIELDVDNRVFHVVYNPNPDFVSLLSDCSFDELGIRLMQEGIHPQDVDNMSRMQDMFSQKLFVQNQRKYSFRCRLYNPMQNVYSPYEITLLRANTDVQRVVLAVFHELKNEVKETPQALRNLLSAPAMVDLMSAPLRCSTDRPHTIVEGQGNLLTLTGYTARALEEEFSNSLEALVASEDKAVFAAMLQDPLRDYQPLKYRYRLRRRTGETLWVQDRCRLYQAPDGSFCWYHALCEINECMEKQAKLEAVFAHNQVIIDQTEGVIFRWDIAEDIMHFTEKWTQRFGYGTVYPNFSMQVKKGILFHPDDMPKLQQFVEGLHNSCHTDALELRIVNSSGRYLWSRIRATSIGKDSPTHIIGIVYDINELKSDALRMRQQAQRDSLTKLLNKASVQEAISNHLGSNPQDCSALLMMDLDNFKMINDTLGHLYGDAVLTQIGSTLRSLFRSQDLIGRIGGDEFLIFLKNVPDQTMLEDRCRLLVETFYEQLHKLMPELPVSISIGCAISPIHGKSYTELFRNADEALYSAKRKGKNQFIIYSPQEKYEFLMDTASRITRIDSDSQETVNDDSLIRFVFQSLYESRDIDATIDELLSFIGTHFNVSRVYIFENNDDNTACSNTFEWCNEGISPEKDNLQDVSYITDIPSWQDVYDEKGVLYCADVKDLPPNAQEILEPQGIKSMLQCAILDHGVFRGYVGFDECTGNRLWTQGQVALLEFLAQVLAVFLIKERNRK